MERAAEKRMKGSLVRGTYCCVWDRRGYGEGGEKEGEDVGLHGGYAWFWWGCGVVWCGVVLR